MPRVSSPALVSSCNGPNAEAVQATDGPYVYEAWIGCDDGIGFARSVDGGATFGPAVTLPESNTLHFLGDSWDPAIAVAPDGTVYVSFMVYRFVEGQPLVKSPVVDVSFDHGVAFPQSAPLPVPPSTDPNGNWGDRPFIAVAPNGNLYVTWDYGPSYSQVQLLYAGNNEHLVEAVAPRTHTAYVAWQTNASDGYTTYLRPFSIERGWLTPTPVAVSDVPGDPTIWPGDTFGLSSLDDTGRGPIGPTAVVSWGSAIDANPNAQIYAATVDFGPGPFFAELPHGNQGSNGADNGHARNH